MERAPRPGALPDGTNYPTPPVKVPEQLMLIEEVAQYLRVSTRSVNRRVKDGLLPCIRIGKSSNAGLRFRREAVELFLQQNT